MKKVRSEILNREFNYKAIHLQLTVDDDLWIHDSWSIIIDNETFNYRTGIGHRTVRYGTNLSKEAKRLLNMRPKQTKENFLIYASKLELETRVKTPEIDDVLYSLVIDSSCIDEGFNEWCDCFGYDNDSKNQSIYHDCIKNSRKLKSIGIEINSAVIAFEDY